MMECQMFNVKCPNSLLCLFKWLRSIERGFDRNDVALFVEGHLVNAHLTMDTWLSFHKVLIDAVIDDVPFVFTWNLENGVVGCAVDFLFWYLLDDTVVLLVNLDVAQWTLAGAVTNVIVG